MVSIGARKPERKPKDEPKRGTYLARLVGITDLGHQPAFAFEGGVADAAFKLTFTYEFPNSKMEDGRPHWVSEDMKNSNFFDKKKGISSTLMKRVFAMDPGGVMTEKGEKLETLINQPCFVSVDFNEKGYIRITNVTGAPEGIPVPELANDPFIFTFDEPNIEMFRRFPEFVQNKIKSALNFEGSPLEAAVLKAGLMGDEEEDEEGTGNY